MNMPTRHRYLDDRGTPVIFAPSRAFADRLGIRATARHRFGAWAVPVVIFGGAASLIAWHVHREGWPTAAEIVPYIATLCMGFLMLGVWTFCTRLVQPRTPRGDVRLPRDRATALAWGHCGACGTGLRDISADDDGCVVCPKCQSAWHADRWARGKIAEHDVRRALYDLDEETRDARGVELIANAYSRLRWLEASPASMSATPATPSRAERRIRAIREMDNVRGVWLMVTALLVVGSIVLLYQLADLLKPLAPIDVTKGGLVLFIPIMMGSLSWSRSRATRGYARASLKQGLCPNCVMIFSTARRIEFDGCVSCEHCGRAWQPHDIRHPLPPDPAPRNGRESAAYRLGRALARRIRSNG